MADFAMNDAYVYPGGPALSCPLIAFGSTEDGLVSGEDLHAWEAHTMAAWSLKIYPGDHFYLRWSPQPVIEDIAQAIGVSASAGMDA